LRRDIRRALTGPLSSPHQRSPSSEGSSFSNDLEITEDDIKNARDSSLVCHQSLRLLSDLLRFPALYSIFSSVSITSLCVVCTNSLKL
jgi:hypothetical protein